MKNVFLFLFICFSINLYANDQRNEITILSSEETTQESVYAWILWLASSDYGEARITLPEGKVFKSAIRPYYCSLPIQEGNILIIQVERESWKNAGSPSVSDPVKATFEDGSVIYIYLKSGKI
ncbi:MAG: hypothetical protein LUF85_03370 [Bacteroides sp.]|nr:hypothetical protein [Bacteroides sp.]